MNERFDHTGFEPLESVLDSAIQSVLAEPLPDDAAQRVKARAKSLDATSALRMTLGVLRRIWHTPLARYGSLAAAVMLLVGGVSLTLFFADSTGVAFAQVIENVKRAETVQLTITSQFGRDPEQTIKTYIKGNRARTELFDGKVIQLADLDKKRRLSLDSRNKVAVAGDIDEQTSKRLANPIDQLRRVKPKDAEYIGEERLDGRLPQVYRIRKVALWGMSGTGQMMVWVDPENGLPVKIVVHDPDRIAETRIRLEDFVWNEPLDDSLFSLNIPDGYKTKTLQALVPRKDLAKSSTHPQFPDPQFAEGFLSRDRAASRIAWGPKGVTLTAIMRDPESVHPHHRNTNELRQWNVATGELLWSVDLRGSASFATSNRGTKVATVIGYELQLRDPANGQLTQKWSTEKNLLPLAFSPDGKTLAAGIAEWGQQPGGDGQEGGVQFWNVEHGTLLRSVSDDQPTTFIRYSPDGQTLASAPNGGPVKLWNTATDQLVRIFPYGGKMDFSPDSRLIACMASKPLEGDSLDDVRKRYDVQIYELQTGKLTKTLTSDDHDKESYVLWIEFSPDGRLIAVANWDGTVKLWDVLTGELVKTIVEHKGGVHTAVFARDGKTLATGSEDRMLRLWKVDQLLAQ